LAKYEPLKTYLQSLGTRSVELTFHDVESIIDDTLPRSSGAHRAWWSNDLSHVQAEAWINAGWSVDTVDTAAQYVKFKRNGA
jgi:hypothetical protein